MADLYPEEDEDENPSVDDEGDENYPDAGDDPADTDHGHEDQDIGPSNPHDNSDADSQLTYTGLQLTGRSSTLDPAATPLHDAVAPRNRLQASWWTGGNADF